MSSVIPRLPPESPARQGQRLTFRSILTFILSAGVGAAGAILLIENLDAVLVPAGHLSAGVKLGVVAALPLVWFLAVGTHELGHLLAGKATGGRFVLFGVGPLILKRTPVGLRLTWNPRLLISGGLVVCLPLDGRNLPPRLAFTIAGGPLASVFLAVGAGIAGIMLLRESAPAASAGFVFLQHVTIYTAALSAVIGAIALFPAVVSGFKTDGRRLWDFLRGGPQRDHEAALLLVAAASLAGVRPRDYPPHALEHLDALQDRSLWDLHGRFYLYRFAGDRENWAAAQRHLDIMIDHEAQLPAFMRQSVRAEYAWLVARRTGNPVVARDWLASAGAVPLHPAVRLRAEAAIRHLEGDTAGAVQAARAAADHLERDAIGPVPDRWEQDLVAELLTAPPAAPVSGAA